jgi:hypothetical protein
VLTSLTLFMFNPVLTLGFAHKPPLSGGFLGRFTRA